MWDAKSTRDVRVTTRLRELAAAVRHAHEHHDALRATARCRHAQQASDEIVCCGVLRRTLARYRWRERERRKFLNTLCVINTRGDMSNLNVRRRATRGACGCVWRAVSEAATTSKIRRERRCCATAPLKTYIRR